MPPTRQERLQELRNALVEKKKGLGAQALDRAAQRQLAQEMGISLKGSKQNKIASTVGRGRRLGGRAGGFAGVGASAGPLVRTFSAQSLANRGFGGPGSQAVTASRQAALQDSRNIATRGRLHNELLEEQLNQLKAQTSSAGRSASSSGLSGLGGESRTPLDPTRFQRRKEDRMQRGELRGERLSDLRAQLAIEEEFKRRALRSRLRDLRGLLRGGRGDELTTTREELVNIAGRPELRQTRETREVDRTQDLINLLLRG